MVVCEGETGNLRQRQIDRILSDIHIFRNTDNVFIVSHTRKA